MSPKITDQGIVKRWLSFYGEKNTSQIQHWNGKGIGNVIRVNVLKSTIHQVKTSLARKKFVLSKTSLNFAFKIVSQPRYPTIGATHEFLLGFYTIQGLASQFVPSIFTGLDSDHIRVLDMTAAPGGKTSLLASLMKNKGFLLSIDSSKKRIPALRSTLSRLGVINTTVLHGYAQKIVENKKLGMFDKILLDAPCTGSGSICRHPTQPWKKNMQDINRLKNIQINLLEQAFGVLKPNGELIYSTCSLEPEEGEMQIAHLLQKYPDDIILEQVTGLPEWSKNIIISSNIGKTEISNEILSKTLRILPNKYNEGFFISKIKRKLLD